VTVGPTDPSVVRKPELGRLDQLASGGNGVIYRVPDYHLASAPQDLVYKEFRRGKVTVQRASLLRIVRVRSRLEERKRQTFDQLTAWPLQVVEEADGTVAGVVMPLIPQQFFEQVHLPSGRFEVIAREVQHLFVAPERGLRNGFAVPSWEESALRLRVCGRFAFAIGLMHRCDVVYGDISARNTLYSLSPRPAVVFVDCDAVRIAGSAAVVKQQNTPDWDAPESKVALSARRPIVLSKATDRYKLGLFILRCLTPGPGSSVNREPSVAQWSLDPEGMELLRRALQGQPAERTTAKEWHEYLTIRLGEGRLKGMRSRPPAGRPARSPDATVPKQPTSWIRGPDGTWRPV
jgi:serine/threonine protein kinase